MSLLFARWPVAALLGLLASACAFGAAPPPAVPTAAPTGASQDFDFEHGAWQTTVRRRLRPLSGSDEWAEYTGTTLVRPLLGGRANVAELDVAGPKGRIQGVALRLFEPQQRRWTLNFASVASGTLTAPVAGGFGGSPRGVFYGDDDFDGRRVRVRFVIEPTGTDRWRFEQAFSADGGATWEINWIAVDTRS